MPTTRGKGPEDEWGDTVPQMTWCTGCGWSFYGVGTTRCLGCRQGKPRLLADGRKRRNARRKRCAETETSTE